MACLNDFANFLTWLGRALCSLSRHLENASRQPADDLRQFKAHEFAQHLRDGFGDLLGYLVYSAWFRAKEVANAGFQKLR